MLNDEKTLDYIIISAKWQINIISKKRYEGMLINYKGMYNRKMK